MTGRRPFVHLHVHSQYSLLNGAIRLPDLFKAVKADGMDTVAVTDDGNLFGAVDFQQRAKGAGVRPIFGVDAYISAGRRDDPEAATHRLVLLARDTAGWTNLIQLVSFAALEGVVGGHPRIDLELLDRHREGLIALSGDADGEIPDALANDRLAHAATTAARLHELMGPDGFYLEVIPVGLNKRQEKINTGLRKLGQQVGVPLVAANNCLYLEKQDARAHDVLLCIQQGRTLSDDRRRTLQDNTYWFKPAEVMWRELEVDFADALENTLAIADRCRVEIKLGETYLPDFPVPDGLDIGGYMGVRAREGLSRRFDEAAEMGYSVDRPTYEARLTEELGIIESMGFPGYFMIVQDFINWAKEQEIPVGPGRGSGAGSLVAYALRITDIDPIPYGLLFERFLNPERVSMPDFDIDFCMNRRGEVIDYVTRKYGKDNVGQIATFGSLKARAAIKDVGRAMGMSFSDRDRIAKLVPDVLGITLAEAIEQEPRLKEIIEEDDKIKELFDVAKALEGLFKSTGMHAAGVVIGDKPLWHYCPVFRGVNDELVTQFAKDEVEKAGLVKFDFLGLKTLTVIDDAVRMINRHRPAETRLDLSRLRLDDPEPYALIGRADTEGVFQLESSGFQDMLRKLRPDCFEDIVAAVALYRPGPMGSGMHLDFIARKHGRQRISYPHPCLEDLLRDTYGVIVYQEQVMQIAQVMAGFTLGGADLLRRAMGKKKAEEMAKQRSLFAAGAEARGIDATVATDVFDLMEKFAQYGFNKSHSAAYALLTYQTAYLKAHHKVEFMAAVLSNDRDNADKVAKGIRTAQKIGIAVTAPDVNRSLASFDAVDGRILFGMAGIKGVGETAVEAIMEARASGPFASLPEFCERVDLRRVNKKTIEALIKSGALDFCQQPRARLLAMVDAAVERAQNLQRDREAGQANLFALLGGGAPASLEYPAEVQRLGEWPEQVLLAHEKDALGFYVSGHPLDRFEDQIRKYATATVEGLTRCDNFARVTLAGVITARRIRPLRSGDGKMGILLFEDRTGSTEIICSGADLDRYEALLQSDEPLLITGSVRIDREDGQVQASVRVGGRRREAETDDTPAVQSLRGVRDSRSRGLEISLRTPDADPDRIERLAALLRDPAHSGLCAARLRLVTPDDCEVVLDLPELRLAPSDELTLAVRDLFDGRCGVQAR